MSSTAKRSDTPVRLALTPGEPAGIGPDITVMLAQHALPAALACFADPDVLQGRARQLGLPLELRLLASAAEAREADAGVLQVVPVSTQAPVVAGRLDPGNAEYVLECLARAVDACRSGAVAGMVTGPVQKSVVNDAGHPFTGHTEFLAERCGAPLPVMMLVAGTLRVVLVTTHVALREVPALVTAERVTAIVEITARALSERFGRPRPRIALCGLNPHAGEGGHLGHEEIDVIAPTVAKLRRAGHDVDGPLPADTVFTAEQRERYDAIVAMYHDQGLAALKALGFGAAVNVTLGLPIVRTSVDHGTALDLAGRGGARADSLLAALRLAHGLARGHD
ncbi:MAG: 4-hydroxythreonine-4-phosphate dehydrogenase PdxA [Gammaproteobacteria bacterium]